MTTQHEAAVSAIEKRSVELDKGISKQEVKKVELEDQNAELASGKCSFCLIYLSC